MLLLLAALLLLLLSIVLVTNYKDDAKEAYSASSQQGEQGYRVVEYPGFLTPEEARAVRDMAAAKGMEDSRLFNANADVLDKSVRISQQTWLYDQEGSALVRSISERVSKIVGLPVENQEPLQVVRYGPGGKYDAHYDACDEKQTGSCERMNGAGPRLWTFLIYLNEVQEGRGGTTTFPRIQQTVRPELGKAVLFKNVDEKTLEVLPESLHGGDPLFEGEKWIANKWIRAGTFLQ